METPPLTMELLHTKIIELLQGFKKFKFFKSKLYRLMMVRLPVITTFDSLIILK